MLVERPRALFALSACCPPNVVRTIAEVSNYVYSVSSEGLWLNLYDGNKLSTKLNDGSTLRLTRQTNYPWDGNNRLVFDETPEAPFSLYFRIPGWCHNTKVLLNGKLISTYKLSGSYAEIKRHWSKDGQLQLTFDMPATLIEANPLVEETRNQVAVKRGPLVYCIESVDLNKKNSVFELTLSNNSHFKPAPLKINKGNVINLETTAKKQERQIGKISCIKRYPKSLLKKSRSG